MGKAIITQNNGDGWYFADEVYDNSLGAAMHEKLTAEILSLNEKIAALEAEKISILVTYGGLIDSLNVAILNQSDTEATTKALSITEDKVQRVNYRINVAKSTVNSDEFKLRGLSAEPDELVNMSAWSADFNPYINVGVVVGIVDRKRVDQAHAEITIKPSFRNGAVDGYLWDEIEDGVLQKREGSTSTGWAFNYSMIKGFDTWNPRYVFGRIVSVDHSNNSGVVAVQSESVVPLGGDSNLIDATFNYYPCNSIVFIEGDLVIVDVSIKGVYEIIGFQSIPQACIGNSYESDAYLITVAEYRRDQASQYQSGCGYKFLHTYNGFDASKLAKFGLSISLVTERAITLFFHHISAIEPLAALPLGLTYTTTAHRLTLGYPEEVYDIEVNDSVCTIHLTYTTYTTGLSCIHYPASDGQLVAIKNRIKHKKTIDLKNKMFSLKHANTGITSYYLISSVHKERTWGPPNPTQPSVWVSCLKFTYEDIQTLRDPEKVLAMLDIIPKTFIS